MESMMSNSEEDESTTALKRLHIGCGTELLEGWVNIDLKEAPGVQALDVGGGLPFADVEFIFAEHFIEHLSFAEGRFFVQECRRVMRDDGVLRLSTPNLDWVWMTQYHPYEWSTQEEGVRDCFWMNKAFRGWGHQFLYNAQTLTALLKDAGFEQVKMCHTGRATSINCVTSSGMRDTRTCRSSPTSLSLRRQVVRPLRSRTNR